MSVSSMTYTGAVCATDQQLLENFMGAVGGGAGSAKMTLHGVADVFVEPVHPENIKHESKASLLRESDFCVLLVRHLHAAELFKIVDLVRNLPSHAAQNLHVTICRNANEHEYKISCTKCQQNLIVHDAHAFNRVRCPHCKDVFIVPGQTDLIRGVLLLNASRIVRKVTLGDAASRREAIAHMISQTRQPAETAKRSTMRIELPPLD